MTLFFKLAVVSILIWLIYQHRLFQTQKKDLKKQQDHFELKQEQRTSDHALVNQQHMFHSLHSRRIPPHTLNKLKFVAPQHLSSHEKMKENPDIYEQTYGSRNLGGAYTGNVRTKKKNPKPTFKKSFL